MSTQGGMPPYMAQLLDELGWNQGTRIPLANPENQTLEDLWLSRQNEIQQLKETLIAQNQKLNDINKYKQNVLTEYQENTRLLFAHKQQLEQEVKITQLAVNEANRLERDVINSKKENKDLNARMERFQKNITRLLKKADSLKNEVCAERGALQEWRAAIERGANDITAIDQFTKQDLSKFKNLEVKRQNLKVEHDQLQQRLNDMVSNVAAEERACERVSVQVREGMEQRKLMMVMWTAAIENLRQRDTDIRHIREDYSVLETEAASVTEQCREQQAFCEQQRNNNVEAQRENQALNARLSQVRSATQRSAEENTTLESEAKSMRRELANMQTSLERLHIENRQIMEDQYRKDQLLKSLTNKIQELKEKLRDSRDTSKTSEKRAKELEDILNDEERYATGVTKNQQRAMHCSFVEQQKLLALKNEEKLFYMQLKASKAIICKMATKQQILEKNLRTQKESFYVIAYQVETLGARVAYMEGIKADRQCNAELVEKENRLKDVCARHAARVALLERHSAKLHDDMRRLTRELELKGEVHAELQSRLKSALLTVDGGYKEVAMARDAWRRERVEEALTRLKVAHAARAVAGLDDAAYTLEKQRLQLDAAMNERMVEIAVRRDMFSVQKRAVFHDCGKLRSDIREREQRVVQLMKRYEIFISSLGRDESGQQLSVTFFKIKFAAERAELRERGAALDAELRAREKDVSALEAALRVVHAAHAHFIHNISPLTDDTPEMQEVNQLKQQGYELRDELKVLTARVAALEQSVGDLGARLTLLHDKSKQLAAREAEAENDLEAARERMARQESRLQNARDIVKHNAKRAKKLVEGVDEWRIFQMALWVRDYTEAAHTGLHALSQLCANMPEVKKHYAALVASTDMTRYLSRHQRRLSILINRIVLDAAATGSHSEGLVMEMEGSVFSTSSESARSGVSVASGFTKRLCAFRKTLGEKVQEHALLDEIPEYARRSTVSLRVVTLGMEESMPAVVSSTSRSRRALR